MSEGTSEMPDLTDRSTHGREVGSREFRSAQTLLTPGRAWTSGCVRIHLEARRKKKHMHETLEGSTGSRNVCYQEEFRRTRWLPGSERKGKARASSGNFLGAGRGRSISIVVRSWAHIPALPVSGWVAKATRPPPCFWAAIPFSPKLVEVKLVLPLREVESRTSRRLLVVTFEGSL